MRDSVSYACRQGLRSANAAGAPDESEADHVGLSDGDLSARSLTRVSCCGGSSAPHG